MIGYALQFCLVLLYFLGPQAAAGGPARPKLENAQLDLGSWRKVELMIHGRWLVLPDQYVNRSNYRQFDLKNLIQDPHAIMQETSALFVPDHVAELDSYKASFIIWVKNAQPRSLGLYFEGFKNDYQINIYVPDSEFFFTLDAYGGIQQKAPLPGFYTSPSRFYNLDSIAMMGKDFFVIINSRSSFPDNQNTLGVTSFKIASSKVIEAKELGRRMEQFLLLGIYLMLMIYSLAIFLLRRDDRSSLTLFLLSLFLAGRYVFTERLLLSTDSFYALASYTFVYAKIFHTAASFATVVFIYQKYSDLISKRLLWFSLAFPSAGWLDVYATYSWNNELMLLASGLFLSGFTFLVIPYFMYVGWKVRSSGGLYVSISLAIFTAAMINDFVMAVMGPLEPIWLGHFGMLAMAIGFALVNAKIFSNTYQKSLELNDTLEVKNQEISGAYDALAEKNKEIQVFNTTLSRKNEEITYFNKNLEHLVKEKTQEITALLDHIPQGVLSLEEGGVISKDFSKHLLHIVEDHEISGRTFKDLILDRSSLSSDLRNQAWETLQVVIGEPEINFEVNFDKLPTELTYTTRQSQKWLKVTWNVEVQDGIVKKVLVTLLDATKEKALEHEAEQQRHEFEILRELVDAGARKIGQYFVSASALLHENERILEQTEADIDHPEIQTLFINMHTIKGGARTLGLKELATVFHEVEEYYQNILKYGESIQKDRLAADLKRAFTVYGHYQFVNKSKLNRSEDYSKVVIDREFIEEHYQILRDIVTDLDRKEQPIEKIIDRIHSQKETMIKLIFDQLPAVFDEYKSKAEKIAKELNKPKPAFDFSLDSISITPEIKSLLDNCMVHLLRNALCHGIESAEERVQASKAEAGTLAVKSSVVGGFLTLEFSDDGRGLAIQKLKEKGLENGLIRDTATVQEIAELIFAAGLSTANSVTHVSGRGVGMDAVRKFLGQHGGDIEVRLGNPKDASKLFYSFKFVLQIPMQKPKVFPSLVKAS